MSELSGHGIRAAVTPQSEQADPRQVKNLAGGFTFQLDHWDHLLRFLVLGTAGGTYYAGQTPHTKQAITTVDKCLDLDGVRAVNLVVEVSEAGRAIRNDQAIFVLAKASAHKDDHVKRAALAALPKVCRTATHLFQFVELVKEYRGFGRGLRSAIAAWYEDKDVDQLAYQLVKYRQRNGWTHRDTLRLSHPTAVEANRKAAFDFACGRGEIEGNENMPAMIKAFDLAQRGWDYERIQREYDVRLPWEAMPSMDAATWAALINTGALPIGAMIRQIPTMTRAGVFTDKSVLTKVLATLTDPEVLRKGRIHPFAALVAHKTYGLGRSFRGSAEWTPVTALVDALDEAFYLCFGNVEPMGGNTLIALDVSGSMSMAIANSPISCCEGTAALSLVTMNAEAKGSVDVVGFTSGRMDGSMLDGARSGLTPLTISPRQRLGDAVREVQKHNWGGTDCALPALWATQNKTHYDQFIIMTDNDTWAGRIHPHQAMRDYRKAVNPQARMVVVGMNASDFTIADPSDGGMLDVVGFDAAAPGLISDFCRGEL